MDKHKTIIKGSNPEEELKCYQLNKPLPETLSIEDILSDMKNDKFLIRPSYQRSEVKNLQKASYLMESILLGINIPPIFIYKRSDKIKEVIDGQQRLTTFFILLCAIKKIYNEYKEQTNTVILLILSRKTLITLVIPLLVT